MNIIELKPAILYPEAAGHTMTPHGDSEHHSAYMVLGRMGSNVLVVEGTGPEELAAIEHLVRKVKLVRDYMDVSCHGAFWQAQQADANEQKERFKRLMSGLGAPQLSEAPKKKDDGGDMSS